MITDAGVVTGRNLRHFVRQPQLLLFSTIQPIILILLFTYVFGGAIRTPGFSYVNFLIPGIIVQNIAFGGFVTAIGLNDDLHKGLIERFRSLPMARSAVLVGRTMADLFRNLFVVVLMTIVGVAVGFRPDTNVFAFLAGVGLILLFAFALSWGFAIIGLAARNAETAQAMAFPLLFPLTFASSAFVPVDSMPGWLQVYARHQPVSVVVDATRALMVGDPTSSSVLVALAWTVGLLAILIPLAVRRYRRAT